LLLYAWGWSVVGMIAYWVGLAALLGAVAVFLGLLLGFVMHRRHADSNAPARMGTATGGQPLPAV
jgi:hypothetical protein